MHFFLDSTEVKFTCIDRLFNVSSVLCEFTLPSGNTMTIRWYGAIIAFGLTLAVLFGGRTAYKWKIDINKMIDVLIYGSIAGVIGARAYYVFSEWGYYSAYPSEIIKIWHGGLAIYGGLIGGIAAAIVVCLVEKINIRNLLDLCGMSFLIGQGIGRWGNFANQEAFGTNTSLPWGMYSEKTCLYLTNLVASGKGEGIDPSLPVHPTFLYESLWCLLGFAFLFYMCRKHRKFSGQIFLLYGIWYGTERAFVEGLRTDSLYIGNTGIRTSQLLSVVLVAVCAVLYVIFYIKYTKNPRPIEGIDYFREIPLYRYNKKADDARKLFEAAEEKAVSAEAQNRPEAADLRKKADALKEKYETAKRTAQEDADRIAAKKAKRKKNNA